MKKSIKDIVFYEIYPSSFADSNGDGIGDLGGVIAKLDYVQQLGFEGIWLNPIYDSPFLDGGYDVRDFFKIAGRFGSLADLKQLIAELHRRQMVLLLDLVPGHASSQNPDFLRSAAAEPNECSDLFIWNDSVWDNEPGYRLISGFYDRNGAYLVNFFAHQPAINYGFAESRYPWQKLWSDPAVPGRAYLEKIMKFYLALGVDGFRVDMADSLVKNEDDKKCTIALWQSIIAEVKSEYPDLWLSSEWSNPDRSLAAGFDSDFVLDHSDNCSHKLFRQSEGGERPLLVEYSPRLYKEFAKDLRWRVEAAKKRGGHLSFISGNHDTIRLANYLEGDELKLAYLFLLTSPGVPFIYAGDELGQRSNTALPSKEGGYHRSGSRTPMAFDNSINKGFSTAAEQDLFLPVDRDLVPAAEQFKDESSLLNFVAELVALRRANPELRSDDFELLDKPLVYRRGALLVAINLKDEVLLLPVKSGEILCTVGGCAVDRGRLRLERHQGVIYREK